MAKRLKTWHWINRRLKYHSQISTVLVSYTTSITSLACQYANKVEKMKTESLHNPLIQKQTDLVCSNEATVLVITFTHRLYSDAPRAIAPVLPCVCLSPATSRVNDLEAIWGMECTYRHYNKLKLSLLASRSLTACSFEISFCCLARFRKPMHKIPWSSDKRSKD